jgi:hypothetical protein
VKRDPISPKMLKVNGDDVMRLTGLPQSIKVGLIMQALLEEVLEDPERNEKGYLEKRVEELNALPEKELAKLAAAGREKKQEAEAEAEAEIKKKFKV